MSDVQNQEQADVSQMAADEKALASAFQKLASQVAALQASAAAAPTGAVPADVQAKIDALHTFAQSVAPASPAPAPTDQTDQSADPSSDDTE